MKVYALYFIKKERKLEIDNWSNRRVSLKEGELYRHNDCIYLALDRKILREKAKELQEQWIKEYEEELEAVKNMKIVTKY